MAEAIEGSVVVTGGSRGIGRAIVNALLETYLVVALDLDPSSDPPNHPRLKVIKGSAETVAGVRDAVEAARALAPLCGWVNNAATFDDPDLLRDGADRFLSGVERNLRPVIQGTAAAVGEFRRARSGGAIVNISSHQALRPVRGAAAYAAAKATIEGFTRAAAVDYGHEDIRVNAVAPGSIDTERHRQHLAALRPDEAATAIRLIEDVHPLGRIGEADEVASAVRFLLSRSASFITGAVVPVDGGRSVLGIDPEQR